MPKSNPYLNLEGKERKGETFDLGRYEIVRVASCSFVDCHFDNFEGYMDLGVGFSRSIFDDCVFRSLRIQAFNTGYATFQRCQFLEFQAKDFRSHDTEFIDCTFEGAIDGGVLDFHYRDLRGEGEVLRFSGNNFEKCSLPTGWFRGDVDLRRQRFSATDGSAVIYDVKLLQVQLMEAFKAKAGGSKRMSMPSAVKALLDLLVLSQTRFASRQFNVSAKRMRALGSHEDFIRQLIVSANAEAMASSFKKGS